LNIWDLTVYQVYDLFARMQQNTIFDVLKMSVAVNRAADKTNKINNAAVICAAYKDGCLIDVSVCGDENSGLHGYARFKTEINAANADRISIFIRDKNLIKPIDMYEIR
ncbi:MAG: hypothetical protein KH216_09935, partial [Clostridiales bacterium]|nr:hypothetical protein [Clostridiales bacterium]